MIRLHFIVEGQTEEAFVNRILKEPLASRGVATFARCVETSRSGEKIHRGGVRSYVKIRNDLLLWMKQDQNADVFFTSMIDLYGLPTDFPGWDQAKSKKDPYARVVSLEESFAKDLNHPRFVPYLQLHEFEALLMAAPNRLESYFSDACFRSAIDDLAEMVSHFKSPELINDGKTTAPSKRITSKIQDYHKQKTAAAPIVAQCIGLETMRNKCPHFSEWLDKLELLGSSADPGSSR